MVSQLTWTHIAYDGNGNVTALVNAADGTMLANYEYSPFGETIRSTGSLAKNNPFRFSTKYDDDESDFLYYGYRYYKPNTGTWMSRDPIGEKKGADLYDFVRNDALDYYDIRGLCSSGTCGPDITAALDRTMANVEFLFWKWDDSLAWSACDDLYDWSGGKFGSAWDIRQLKDMGTHPITSPCSRTVTYKGKCHYAGAANYDLWGKANLLCKQRFGDPWSLAMAIALDFGYFHLRHYPMNDEQWDKIGFTIYGYTGGGLYTGAKDCDPNTVPIKNFAFDWRWRPAKEWSVQK